MAVLLPFPSQPPFWCQATAYLSSAIVLHYPHSRKYSDIGLSLNATASISHASKAGLCCLGQQSLRYLPPDSSIGGGRIWMPYKHRLRKRLPGVLWLPCILWEQVSCGGRRLESGGGGGGGSVLDFHIRRLPPCRETCCLRWKTGSSCQQLPNVS